jgi:hypothetical protein
MPSVLPDDSQAEADTEDAQQAGGHGACYIVRGGAMEYRRLGTCGLKVSRLGLGCGNFGGIGSAPAFYGWVRASRKRSR